MSEHKVSGKMYFLYIDPAGGTDYGLVVCIENQAWQGTSNVIDATSKCGPDTAPGTQTNSVTFDGQQLFDPTAPKVSGASLFLLWQNQTTIGWKISPDPSALVDGDEILSGTGWISDLSKTYNQDENTKFSGTLSIYGATIQTIFEGS